MLQTSPCPLISLALRLMPLVLAAVCVGCPRDGDLFGEDLTMDDDVQEMSRLPLPTHRLPRDREDELLDLIDEYRGPKSDFLARTRAYETIGGMLVKDEAGVIPYVVELLSEPSWEIRAGALRMVIKHGKQSPEAVAALVQVVGDMKMNSAVRNDAALALRNWSGEYFGYNAWDDEEEIQKAAARWKSWLDITGGVIRAKPREATP